MKNLFVVVSWQAGIQVCEEWIPAFAGMTPLCRLSSYGVDNTTAVTAKFNRTGLPKAASVVLRGDAYRL